MHKNKAEREKFLKEYEKWANLGGSNYDYKTINAHEISLKFHRFQFKNGAAVIVTECPTKQSDGKTYMSVRYNLIIPEGDDYNPYDMHSGRAPSVFRGYCLQGVSLGAIVGYMTKRQREI